MTGTATEPAANVYNATVVGREEINPLLLVFRVRPDGELFQFSPGQFAVLGLLGSAPRVVEAAPEQPPPPAEKLIRRAYSIASSNVERQYLEFYLTLVTSGQLTPRLFATRVGQRLFLGPKPSGFFTLDAVPPGKTIVLIATGTGLAPYMSMLRTVLIHESSRRFIVLHGARYSWDLGYRAELESLSRIRANLTYLPVITRPAEDPHFQGQNGRIQNLIEDGRLELLTGVSLDPDATEVFLCGNPDMIEAVKALLLPRGFLPRKGKAPGTLHVEEYW